ncbi:MAG: hypothetical protein J0L76_06565 [Rhodobacterales bacterium]|nr:hypothetical protein [Rhodobacterales bacterium]
MIRGPISMLIVGAVMLAGLAVVMKGPQAFTRYLPEKLATAIDGGMIGTFDGAVKGSGNRAEDYLDDGTDGLRAHGRIAAMSGNRPVFISDVISGYSTRVGTDIPAEITMVRPISGCRLTPPLAGTAVGHVTAAETGLSLSLLTYNDYDLADAVQGFVDAYRKSGMASPGEGTGLAYQAYDVAVTETRAPVYLVLETARGNRIWNIHLAPGARIERVILLGGDHAGVANLDPVVPVEILPADALAACGIDPYYPLNPGHRFFEVLNGDSGTYKSDAEAKLVVMKERITAYNTWFRDSFGVLADETRAGFDGSTVSVVGPQPGEAEPKAVYAPIRGSRIRMTQDSYFEIRGQVAEGEDFAGRVKAIATSFAFGDLKNLRQGVAF